MKLVIIAILFLLFSGITDMIIDKLKKKKYSKIVVGKVIKEEPFSDLECIDKKCVLICFKENNFIYTVKKVFDKNFDKKEIIMRINPKNPYDVIIENKK